MDRNIEGDDKMITVYPVGTTIYKPEKCYNGYTIICFPIPLPRPNKIVELIDMNGNIVNKWEVVAIRAKLLKNGNLLVVDRRPSIQHILEFSWDGKIVWEYTPPGKRAHHDVDRLPNGNTLVLFAEPVPEEYRNKIRDPARRNVRTPAGKGGVYGDALYEVTPDKRVVWEWHMYEHVDLNRYCKECSPSDWTHVNTVQSLPENKWYDSGDERFKPGNILISPRNLSAIMIIDKQTGEIVWEYTGTYAGGLAGQHEPHMIEKGILGEGNIILFDNGAPPMRSIAHLERSFILEIEPPSGKIVWRYESGLLNFYSGARSSVQRLPNGNALICESEGHRVFEITHEGEIVWEYTTPADLNYILGRSYRYPYDYCPQLESLGRPKEEPVIPPPHVNTRPIRVRAS